ncbi:MAG: enoyl-CoA hydratase-related protein [Vulcanimicrobiaceae bacterium]
MPTPSLVVERDGAVASVRLDRPGARNAFDGATIAELDGAFGELGRDASVRTIVLSGSGAAFCGGADIGWMRASLDLEFAGNRAEAEAMSRMFRTIDRCPKTVIARVHGAALGGGLGLVAVADIAIASHETIFGLTETKLGLLPAVIAPFVLAKIGRSHARALALTGERFGAARALAIGLVHALAASASELDAAVARACGEVASASPSAIAATKALFAELATCDYDASLEPTASAIAHQRTSPEGQEGLRAFLEKRPAAWRE